jgi:hypothetical protein
MKLQTESRRSSVMSTMTLDLSRAGAAPGGGLPPPSARISGAFTPLTGSGMRPAGGHRRGASIASPGTGPTATPDEHDAARRAHSRTPPKAPRRVSGLFTRGASPPENDGDRARRELAAARAQLEETRAELSEAHEARAASETCAQALRAFIVEHGVGADVLPQPKPTPVAAKRASWAFGLWRANSASSVTSSTAASTPLAPIAGSPRMLGDPPKPAIAASTPLAPSPSGFGGSPSTACTPSARRRPRRRPRSRS